MLSQALAINAWRPVVGLDRRQLSVFPSAVYKFEVYISAGFKKLQNASRQCLIMAVPRVGIVQLYCLLVDSFLVAVMAPSCNVRIPSALLQ